MKDIYKVPCVIKRVYDGMLLNGKPNGFGRSFFPDALLTYTGYTLNDIIKGKGIVKTSKNVEVEALWNGPRKPCTTILDDNK